MTYLALCSNLEWPPFSFIQLDALAFGGSRPLVVGPQVGLAVILSRENSGLLFQSLKFFLLLFSGEFLFVSELVFHPLVQQLKTALLSDETADHSGVGLPLLFGFCVPVVLPKELIGFKNRHLINSKRRGDGLETHTDPGSS